MLALFAVISYFILVFAFWNDTILVLFFIWHFLVLIIACRANFSLKCLIRILRRGLPWYMEWNWCCHQSVSRTGSNNWKYGRFLQWDIHPEVPDVLFSFVFCYGSLLFLFTLTVVNLFFPFSRLRHPNGNTPFWLMWTTVWNHSQLLQTWFRNLPCLVRLLSNQIYMSFLLCSYTVSWCMHYASTPVNGYRIYGNGITVLSHPHEWSEKEAQLA
jgi:hypothetical protein